MCVLIYMCLYVCTHIYSVYPWILSCVRLKDILCVVVNLKSEQWTISVFYMNLDFVIPWFGQFSIFYLMSVFPEPVHFFSLLPVPVWNTCGIFAQTFAWWMVKRIYNVQKKKNWGGGRCCRIDLSVFIY